MWPWIKRWRDWAMNDLWPMYRIGPQPQALHYSYEKAGLTVHDQPIPWNAEAVLVEALLRLPPAPAAARATSSCACPASHRCRPTTCAARKRRRPLPRSPSACRRPALTVDRRAALPRPRRSARSTLPFLSREEFLHGLRLQMPTLFVRLGEESVACQTFVASQCRGLLASGRADQPDQPGAAARPGPAGRVPLRAQRAGQSRGAGPLEQSQLAGRQALVTVAPRRYPRRQGAWTATWLLGDRPLATQRVRGISQQAIPAFAAHLGHAFRRATRAAARPPDPAAAAAGNGGRVGPCFLVSSGEPGMAGYVSGCGSWLRCRTRCSRRCFSSRTC